MEEVDPTPPRKNIEELQKAMTELHTLISKEKLPTSRKQQLHESMGTLQNLFQTLMLDNEYFKVRTISF